MAILALLTLNLMLSRIQVELNRTKGTGSPRPPCRLLAKVLAQLRLGFLGQVGGDDLKL